MGHVYSAGDPVTCVDDAYEPDRQLPYHPDELDLPVAGRRYTVRAVVETYMHGAGLLLEEVRNRPRFHKLGGVQEPVFHPRRFVPAGMAATAGEVR